MALDGQAELGVQVVLESQLALSAQIEMLSTELNRLKADADLPALEPFTTSLVSSRKRIAAINATLAQIQERLTRLDKIAAGLPARDGEATSPPPAR
jgi:hypothetical protein